MGDGKVADMDELIVMNETTQYISIYMSGELFGIDIKYVDNIVRMQRITRVPKAQNYFKGVINLRGEVIPVMSLRLKFDFEEAEHTNKTRILIIKPDAQASVGIIVDAVKEVMENPEYEAPKFWINPEVKDFYDFTEDDMDDAQIIISIQMKVLNTQKNLAEKLTSVFLTFLTAVFVFL